ncbi:hypothetical protein ILYODFUR_009632 [Ilyodon furcidens]|uniref:Secreted protein n=1 Tax=Ilyodon furcidens TaxID=33524 RepID=A0ABV0TIK2_9TELE
MNCVQLQQGLLMLLTMSFLLPLFSKTQNVSSPQQIVALSAVSTTQGWASISASWLLLRLILSLPGFVGLGRRPCVGMFAAVPYSLHFQLMDGTVSHKIVFKYLTLL